VCEKKDGFNRFYALKPKKARFYHRHFLFLTSLSLSRTLAELNNNTQKNCFLNSPKKMLFIYTQQANSSSQFLFEPVSRFSLLLSRLSALFKKAQSCLEITRFNHLTQKSRSSSVYKVCVCVCKSICRERRFMKKLNMRYSRGDQ
jgi:hypothetical protein